MVTASVSLLVTTVVRTCLQISLAVVPLLLQVLRFVIDLKFLAYL